MMERDSSSLDGHDNEPLTAVQGGAKMSASYICALVTDRKTFTIVD